MREEKTEFDKYVEKMQSRREQSGVQPYLMSNAGLFQMGSIFEVETIKGNKNYIIFFFVRNGFVYYCHGDKAKKVTEDQFKKLIDYGDVVPVPREKADPEKLSFSVLCLSAMSEGLALNDYMARIWGYGPGSEVR
jgi:predicted glycosyltransferase